MKIVYCSNTGHTKEYAMMLSNKLNIEVVDVKHYKKDNDKIIFIGWIFGSMISGLNKVDPANLVCAVGVGMSPKSEGNTKKIIDVNKIDSKIFYLQGGVDYSKLKGIKKLMLKMVGNSVIKANKQEDKELIEIFKDGGNYVREENLNELVEYINKIKE